MPLILALDMEVERMLGRQESLVAMLAFLYLEYRLPVNHPFHPICALPMRP